MVVAAISDGAQLSSLWEWEAGAPADRTRAERLDARQAEISVFQFLATIACAVVFFHWLYRAHANRKTGGLRRLRSTPGWAVG